jgi:hypothetical protein
MKTKYAVNKGFNGNRLIWVQGEVRKGAVRLSAGSYSGGDPVWHLSPAEFISLVFEERLKELGLGPGVIAIQGFEHFTGWRAREMISALAMFLASEGNAKMRLVLYSRGEVSLEIKGIYGLSPLVISLRGNWDDPQELNSRVHSLIDEASRIAEVPIKRLSEKAADFLEESFRSGEGEELLDLLIEGMRRSDGHTLRFRDLLPHFSKYFDPDDRAESYCN